MSAPNPVPETFFLGSTEFYISAESDEFTPSHLQAAPLKESLTKRLDGTIPEWLVEGSTKSPAEQFVEWFNHIWHTGDPSLWGPSVFTNDAVLIDPSGVSRGANQGASLFLMLFRFFPDLRGEVVSWAANEREIFINWRFSIVQRGSKKPLMVTVVDKFCFVDGRVSFRLAYYDIITFAGYLAETSGQDQLFDFLAENLRQAQLTGGMQLIPRMLGNFVKGLFVWPPHPRSLGLKSESGDGFVKLEWKPFPKAVSYRICRADSINGPYEPPPADPLPLRVEGTSYIDTTVTNGTAYWYSVSPIFEEMRATPVKRRALHPSTHPIAFARPKFFGARRPVH